MPWKEKIEALGSIETIKRPNMGLVMMRAEESVENAVFNVGEVLVSEATVSVDGMLGYGISMGNEQEKAEVLAMIDAVYHSEDKKWLPIINSFNLWLKEQQEIQYQKKLSEFQITKRSFVDFNVMDDE